MVFHDNADKDDTLNDTGLWYISNDNDDYVKIDVVVEYEHE